MTDLDELKKQWKNTSVGNISILQNEKRIIEKLMTKRVSSTRDRLVRNHALAVVTCLLAPFLLLLSAETGIDYPKWIKILYTGFFVIVAGMQSYALIRIYDTNYTTNTITESLESFINYKRIINRMHAISLMMGCIVIGAIFYFLLELENTAALIGGWVGLLFGGIIGLIIHLRRQRQVNEMIEDLRDILSSNEDDSVERD